MSQVYILTLTKNNPFVPILLDSAKLRAGIGRSLVRGSLVLFRYTYFDQYRSDEFKVNVLVTQNRFYNVRRIGHDY